MKNFTAFGFTVWFGGMIFVVFGVFQHSFIHYILGGIVALGAATLADLPRRK